MPSLVVTRITPNAARVPYMAEDDASLSTDISATSSGLRYERSSTGTPSTTIRGEEFCLFERVPTPRMRMDAFSLKSPLDDVMVRPGTAP